jgi:hypothetical protein
LQSIELFDDGLIANCMVVDLNTQKLFGWVSKRLRNQEIERKLSLKKSEQA